MAHIEQSRRDSKLHLRLCLGLLWASALAIATLAVAFPAPAATVSGTVTNGTTKKPVAGADVILLQLQGGMEPVASTKSDANGHFAIDNSTIGTTPMLLRVPYKGVLYHQPVPPGTTTADVQVYEATTNLRGIVVATRAIVLQPKGSSLLVGEEYTIENQTQPPVAYYLKSGTFQFLLPQGAQLNQVTASGPSGMPVVQGTIDKGNNAEAVDWAFRPGENEIRLSYQLPYPSNQTTVHTTSPYAAQRVVLVAPPGLQVTSAGFTPAGTEQGYALYSHDPVAANSPIEIAVSGTAPEPAAPSGDASDAQNPSVNSRTEATDTATTTMPPRLDSLKYILVAGFAALFALGVIFLWRRPVAATAPSPSDVESDPRPLEKPRRRQEKSSVTAEQVERSVSHSLDELKENLFRLELRHQAGTISDQDYARERKKAENLLREFLKG
ncbi:MAG TPA: carboxypeptidase-like regulatory domain-containing protein [Candidatus Acidoferrales bacterium]|nr:carboxypeptidase-like regulatory domain-containing protein [Candidatus Acidoferrales bacterium]